MQRKSSTSVKVFYPKFKKEEIIEKIRNRLKTLKERVPLKSAILFGSYATGNYTVASDIDLLIVYEGTPRDDAYSLAKRHLGIPNLEPHVYCEAEAEEMKLTIARMIKHGIILLTPGESPPF
ncbi:MAG: nucleotidyltransferase domain-containing protein [bacterium]|nr:nucleotidyltransferase domain-containing protein [bacterium]